MGAYHQMGHDSWNLVEVPGLSDFNGIVLSPVNSSLSQTKERLEQLSARQNFDVVLDPQFYRPNSDRGQLPSWNYFDAQMDTADMSDRAWWRKRGVDLVNDAIIVGANAVCSLAVIPRHYSNDYYRWATDCADDLALVASEVGIELFLTAIVPIAELAQPNKPETLASIFTSSTRVTRVYLVLVDDMGPRQPRNDQMGLGGAVKLIRLLEESGVAVLVAFSGLDSVLWKAAGASHIATGKFLNLRRFTPGRWEDQGDEMGRVVPYWTDSQFLAWIREADLVLLLRAELIDRELAEQNPFSKMILELLARGKGEAWVGLAWRQYLWWTHWIDRQLHRNPGAARKMLVEADSKWKELRDRKFYLYESDSNAVWLTAWLNALALAKV